jgi:anti-sigma regulatory factor (Ser/Thr protein kinase)
MQGSRPVRLDLIRIQDALGADVVAGAEKMDTAVAAVYASDLMSDVLAYGKPGSALLTGLNSPQAAISAYMAEFKAVIFIRGKRPAPAILRFAEDKGLVVLSARDDMFEACAKIALLDHAGEGPVEDALVPARIEEEAIRYEFSIDGRDFSNAGMVSTQVKIILKTIGYDPPLVRRVAISTYEGEMNVVMHAERATATLDIGNREIRVVIDDEGKGIPDVALAMQEGWTTATDEQRALGFGSGMGLPNIKKNADAVEIVSAVGKGTRLLMRFFIQEGDSHGGRV